MDLRELKNNIVIYKTDEENVEIDMLINNDEVLKIYTGENKDLEAVIQKTTDYIIEEGIKHKYKTCSILGKHINICKKGLSFKVKETSKNSIQILLDDKHRIILRDKVLTLKI